MAGESSSEERCQEVFQEVSLLTQALQDELKNGENDVESKKELIREFIQQNYSNTKEGQGLGKPRHAVRISITSDLQWVNSNSTRATFDSDAASNLIIFDFFTHCCINCIHSIEDLRQVYEQVQSNRKQNKAGFQCGLKLFSIHSPKFTTEKSFESIKSSAERMKLSHTEVLNDPNSTLWQKFGLYCWPTIFVFGPNVDASSPGPNLMFVFTGEGHKEILTLICEVALEFFDSKLTIEQVKNYRDGIDELNVALTTTLSTGTKPRASDDRDNAPATSLILNFPGKVSTQGDIVAISDSGNNKIIVANLCGSVKHTIGGRDRGYVDGPFETARFNNPQGLAFHSDSVFFVADTGNHCIRMVDMEAGRVSTLIPPHQPPPYPSLKSPWDLTFYDKDVLLIAGAGNHQIFAYFFADKVLFGTPHKEGAFDLIAGTGREENRNNSYILRSSFAQPSGICAAGAEGSRCIFIADSESSSVRMIASDGKVSGLAGGNRDPTDLFTYGDVDGVAFDARLQHPMGITAPHAGKLYVADTYNHKIKKVKVDTKHCTTLIGDGQPGSNPGLFTGLTEPKRLGGPASSALFSKQLPPARLNEPGGLCLHNSGEYLFIADTNNHTIKVAHLSTRIVSEFKIRAANFSTTADRSQVYQEHHFKVPRTTKSIRFQFSLPKIPDNFDGGRYNIRVPAYNSLDAILIHDISKELVKHTVKVTTEDIPYVPWITEVFAIFHIMLCGSKACYRKVIKFRITLDSTDKPADEQVQTFKAEYTPTNKNFYAEDAK